MRIHFNPTGDLRQATVECEAATFLHWYGNSPREMEREYAPYARQSVFVTVTSEGTVVGFCRLIRPGPAGLKSMVDAGRDPWDVDPAHSAEVAGIDLSTSWDVATVGILPGQAATSPAAVAVYHGLARAGRANGVTALVAILDNRVRRVLSSVGLIMHALPGATSRPYLGSPASTPVYADFEKFLATQHRVNPDAYRRITLGIGLDDVIVPAESHFRCAPSLAHAGMGQR